MSLVVVYNPACGDCTAEQFFNEHLIPRLHTANRIPTEIVRTSAPGDAGKDVLNLLNRYKGDITVVLGSGDGTLHEIVNHLACDADGDARTSDKPLRIHFVLVPCGTANALYASLFRPRQGESAVSYKLRSLEAFLSASIPGPLNLFLTTLLGSPGSHHGRRHPQPIASIVVTSTALHAAILRDSEKLRAEMPGIERFKVAAQQNITKWYASRVKLLPVPQLGSVQVYDSQKGDFVPLDTPNGALDVDGPFAYFLSTVNVDRLEPEFRINPTISKIPSLDTSMDVVMVRPRRDPAFTMDTLQEREKFAQKTVAVLHTAYQDGNHINLRYSRNGDITESGDGSSIIECFRCAGWDWIPDGGDEDAHLLCADGTIFEIEKGGRATCRALPRSDTNFGSFYVYA